MHATIRRYEGVDPARTSELTEKVNDTLIPQLSKLPGFGSYYLVSGGSGVMTSVSLFDTQTQADESSRFVAEWIKKEQLENALPNAPKITFGEIVAQKNGVPA
jgi:hypothetical protein